MAPDRPVHRKYALVAQWIEHRPPEAVAQVRLLSGALLLLKSCCTGLKTRVRNLLSDVLVIS